MRNTIILRQQIEIISRKQDRKSSLIYNALNKSLKLDAGNILEVTLDMNKCMGGHVPYVTITNFANGLTKNNITPHQFVRMLNDACEFRELMY